MDVVAILNLMKNVLLYTCLCGIIAAWSRHKFSCKVKISSGLRCYCGYCWKEALVVVTAFQPLFGAHGFAKRVSFEPPAIPSLLESMLGGAEGRLSPQGQQC